VVCYERVGEAYRISTTLTIQTHGLGRKKAPTEAGASQCIREVVWWSQDPATLLNETIAYLPGLSPVAGKELWARFDGGRLSSDGGVLSFPGIERRIVGW
jgi:hypothetical protein